MQLDPLLSDVFLTEYIRIYSYIFMCYESESKLQFLQQRMMKNFHLIPLLIHVNTRLYDELVEFHCMAGGEFGRFSKFPRVPRLRDKKTSKWHWSHWKNFMKFFTPPKN